MSAVVGVELYYNGELVKTWEGTPVENGDTLRLQLLFDETRLAKIEADVEKLDRATARGFIELLRRIRQ